MTIVDALKDAVHTIVPSTATPTDPHAPATAANQLSHAEMSAARLPLAYRDSCAHLLVPLNKCRYDTFYMPWKCEDERHGYEKCQYLEFKKRVAKMEELRAERGGRSGLN